MKIEYPLSAKTRAEHEAYEEENIQQLQQSVLDRTMTKESYRRTARWIREACWIASGRHMGGVGGTAPAGRKWNR